MDAKVVLLDLRVKRRIPQVDIPSLFGRSQNIVNSHVSLDYIQFQGSTAHQRGNVKTMVLILRGIAFNRSERNVRMHPIITPRILSKFETIPACTCVYYHFQVLASFTDSTHLVGDNGSQQCT